jgi:hypothetical protein
MFTQRPFPGTSATAALRPTGSRAYICSPSLYQPRTSSAAAVDPALDAMQANSALSMLGVRFGFSVSGVRTDGGPVTAWAASPRYRKMKPVGFNLRRKDTATRFGVLHATRRPERVWV